MTSLIATDLDRTLIYSRRFFTNALPEGQCVEIYNGEGISFITREAALALRCLAAGHLVVPTTTRTIAQYERIRLPGGPYRYAITSNGGNILVDGTPDQTWIGTLAAFLLYLRMFFEPMQDISQFFNTFQFAAPALEKLAGVMAAGPSICDPPRPVSLQTCAVRSAFTMCAFATWWAGPCCLI